jgi:serine/threonine protein kinase
MNPAPDQNPSTPEQFGPYELYERLGMGGMATVYRAKKRGPEGFERSVALKRMLQHLAEDNSFVESFIREAKVASMLAHPNIAQVYDFGRINGVYYIAMELVAGFDLRRLLRHANRANESIALPVVFSILAELCDALEYAHGFVDETGTPQRIVHRDISPSNLIIAPTGHLKVIDFGIAKANSRNLRTETGMVKGKLGYMAPEVALGMSVGPGADVFSMGVVAWELITASPLFTGRTDFETMRRLREGQIAPPSNHNPTCPPELDRLVLQAVEREVDQRLPSAAAFRRELDGIASRHGIAMSARGVSDWITGMPQTLEGYRGSSPIHEQSTAILRPGQGTTKLRRSEEEVSLASDIWGEDAKSTAQAMPDFDATSVAASGPYSYPLPAPPPSQNFPPSFAQQVAQALPPPRTRRWPLIVIPILLVIAASLAVYLVSRPSKTTAPVAEGSGSALVPARATLKLAITPADSIIAIGGKELGPGAQSEIELDPGVYSVAVRHDGFKPWSTTITLAAGEHQTVEIALVAVEAAPIEVAVATKPAPVPTPAKRPVRKTTHAHAKATSEPADIPLYRTDPVAPPAPDPTPPKPDPIPPPPAQPARTPVVGANAVTKLSGELPSIKADAESGDVLAKLCIDEQGRVSSMKIVKAPAGVADKLQHAFDTWRYKPYINQASKASPVCFPVSVRVIVKRPD